MGLDISMSMRMYDAFCSIDAPPQPGSPLLAAWVSSELWGGCWYALRVDIRFRVGACRLIFVTVAFRLDLQLTEQVSIAGCSTGGHNCRPPAGTQIRGDWVPSQSNWCACLRGCFVAPEDRQRSDCWRHACRCPAAAPFPPNGRKNRRFECATLIAVCSDTASPQGWTLISREVRRPTGRSDGQELLGA